MLTTSQITKRVAQFYWRGRTDQDSICYFSWLASFIQSHYLPTGLPGLSPPEGLFPDQPNLGSQQQRIKAIVQTITRAY